MADPNYKNENFVFASKGVVARSVDDTLEPGQWLNMDECEELAENSISNRLGVSIINRTGSTINALNARVHSLAKLSGLNGSAWRYAGAGGTLWRRTGTSQGAFTPIATNLSGQPWQAAFFAPTDFTAMPYIFIADANGMLKDNGTLPAPQQMGIFQPQYPMSAVVTTPFIQPLEPPQGLASTGIYTTAGVTGFASNQTLSPNTTLASAVVKPPLSPGVQTTVTVNIGSGENDIRANQWVKVGPLLGGEIVFVIAVTQNGFTAFFRNSHSVGEAVVGIGFIGEIAGAGTTGTVTCSFNGFKIGQNANLTGGEWILGEEDYIELMMAIDAPANVQQIMLQFDCGDGSFTDYFYKIIGVGALQDLLNGTDTSTEAAANAIIAETLGVYGNSSGSIAQLAPGNNAPSQLMIQLSDFATAGRADFSDPVYNWQNVGAYRFQFITNSGGNINFKVWTMQLFGGAGPDTFAGVAYDYLFTFYNIVDGTESNPCMVMTNVNPPNDTNWVYPRRSPVQLSLNTNMVRPVFGGVLVDAQVTTVRVYRRGGTLGDAYRRINPTTLSSLNGVITLSDTAADEDIQSADQVSFTNDVPVTSSLPVPVNATLSAAIAQPTWPGLTTFKVNTTASMFPGQQINIGTPGAIANNFETAIIVQVVNSTTVIAYVQNAHAQGEQVTATAVYGWPVTIMTQAFGQMWFAGDTNNPHFLYWSNGNNPQGMSSAAWVPVGSPDDPITAIIQFKGNLYVSTRKFWWTVAPGVQSGQQPTVFPTATKFGCVAPKGYVVTNEGIYYQAIDGIRFFAGGESTYLTQDQEFIWQGVGSSPITEANQSLLSQTQMAYWNNMIFVAYTGVDGIQHRMIFHTVYKRWRNDEVGASVMNLEVDTNTLTLGTPAALLYMDRQVQPYDEAPGNLTSPFPITLQSGFLDQQEPSITKSYQELTIDANTGGATLTITLLFNDGEESFVIGTINTTTRQKVNFNLNSGLGFEYYKVALLITGNTSAFWYLYQCSIKSLPLAKTRQSYDSFWLRLGTDESKVVKQVFYEYTAGADITFSVYYDYATTPAFTFTLPFSNGVRNPMRVRLPAIACRMIRFVGVSTADFQIWESSRIEYKTLGTGKGWEVIEFVPNN